MTWCIKSHPFILFRQIDGKGWLLASSVPNNGTELHSAWLGRCWTHFVTVRRRYTALENICSVGITLRTLVAVDVFETDIKHWWCLRISSLLSIYLFKRSPHSKYAVCMYVRKNISVCIKWISKQIYKTFERRWCRILILLLCCRYSGITIVWIRELYKYPDTYPKDGRDCRTATLFSPSNSKKKTQIL